jgi:hypothetical protein
MADTNQVEIAFARKLVRLLATFSSVKHLHRWPGLRVLALPYAPTDIKGLDLPRVGQSLVGC